MKTNNSKLKSKNQNLNLKSDLRYRSYQFSLSVIGFVSSLPNKRIYWIITDQLLRSATSIGANIIEAKASSSRRDFIKFYQISLKSANETIYWLNLLKGSDMVTSKKLKLLIKEAEELSKMLGSSLLTLKGKKQVLSY